MYRFFSFFTELMGWFKIMASPTLAGCIIGFVVYVYNTNPVGMGIGISIASIGFIGGVVWATHIWKNGGTIHFLSGITTRPEEDGKEEAEQ